MHEDQKRKSSSLLPLFSILLFYSIDGLVGFLTLGGPLRLWGPPETLGTPLLLARGAPRVSHVTAGFPQMQNMSRDNMLNVSLHYFVALSLFPSRDEGLGFRV